MADDCGLASFWELFKAGDVPGISALFHSTPHFEEPFEGSIHGEDELRRFMHALMYKIQTRNVYWEHQATLCTPHRVVCEWQMNAEFPRGHYGPPVAGVGDVTNGKFTAIRIYYSTWPQTGSRGIRLPMLPADNSIVLDGVVGHYQHSLTTANLEGVLDCFEVDGVRRDPRGGNFQYRGSSQLRKFYGYLFRGGGIPLRFCTVTDDGRSCAIEYICDRWGNRAMPPQAGVSVHVRGPTGRLAALRAYDDIDSADFGN